MYKSVDAFFVVDHTSHKRHQFGLFEMSGIFVIGTGFLVLSALALLAEFIIAAFHDISQAKHDVSSFSIKPYFYSSL